MPSPLAPRHSKLKGNDFIRNLKQSRKGNPAFHKDVSCPGLTDGAFSYLAPTPSCAAQWVSPVKNLPVLAAHRDGSLSARENIQDGRSFSHGELPVADLACDFQIDRLRARLTFGNLVKRKAI